MKIRSLPETHSAMHLSRALRAAGLNDMASRAAAGHYHDYLSPLDLPDLQLLMELEAAIAAGNTGAIELAIMHKNGAFDATREESDEWAASPDGEAAYAQMFGNSP